MEKYSSPPGKGATPEIALRWEGSVYREATVARGKSRQVADDLFVNLGLTEAGKAPSLEQVQHHTALEAEHFWEN